MVDLATLLQYFWVPGLVLLWAYVIVVERDAEMAGAVAVATLAILAFWAPGVLMAAFESARGTLGEAGLAAVAVVGAGVAALVWRHRGTAGGE